MEDVRDLRGEEGPPPPPAITAPRRVARLVRLWSAPLAVAVLIFALSGIPGNLLTVRLFVHQDKVAHASVMGLLALCLARALDGTWSLRRGLVLGLAVLGTFIYGVTDELHQVLVPGRLPDVGDLAADVSGGVLGAAAWILGVSVKEQCFR